MAIENGVVEVSQYGEFGIEEIKEMTRLEKLEEIAKKMNKNNRVLVARGGEVKIIRSSHNAHIDNTMKKHGAFLCSTRNGNWVAKDVGRGKPMVVAAEKCHLIRFTF